MVQPLNHFTDIEAAGGGQVRAVIHAYPKYYRDGDPATGTLLATDMRFVPSGHPAISDWVAKKGVWSCYARNDGTYAIKHLDNALKFKLAALVLMKPDKTWEVIATPTYGMPVIDGETLTWANVFNGVDQTLRAVADQTRDVFTISQAARDGLQAWCVNHGYTTDLENHHLAFAYEVDYKNLDDTSAFSMVQKLEGGAEFTNAEDAEIKGRIFHLKDGRVKQYLAGEFRHEADMNARTRKLLRFATVGGKRYFLEGCSLEFFKNAPSGTLISNLTVTYQEGTDAYTGAHDQWLYEAIPDGEGWDDQAERDVRRDGTGDEQTVLLRYDVSALAGATVSNAYQEVYCTAIGAACKIAIHRCFKPWELNDCSWNQWDESATNAWTAGGARDFDDAGVENAGDGVGADCAETPFEILQAVATSWMKWADGVAGYTNLVQDWIDTDADQDRGIAFHVDPTDTGRATFYWNGAAAAANRPKLTIIYTAPTTTAAPTTAAPTTAAPTTTPVPTTPAPTTTAAPTTTTEPTTTCGGYLTGLIVSGAGTAAANGLYCPAGVYNGCTYYNQVADPNWQVRYDGVDRWVITNTGVVNYELAADEPGPCGTDLTGVWEKVDPGALPAPDVAIGCCPTTTIPATTTAAPTTTAGPTTEPETTTQAPTTTEQGTTTTPAPATTTPQPTTTAGPTTTQPATTTPGAPGTTTTGGPVLGQRMTIISGPYETAAACAGLCGATTTP